LSIIEHKGWSDAVFNPHHNIGRLTSGPDFGSDAVGSKPISHGLLDDVFFTRIAFDGYQLAQ
jgi:hypothetical protein